MHDNAKLRQPRGSLREDMFWTTVLQSSISYDRGSQRYANMPTFCTRFSSCSQQATRSRPYRGVTLLSAAAAGCPIMQVYRHCRLLPAIVRCRETVHSARQPMHPWRHLPVL